MWQVGLEPSLCLGQQVGSFRRASVLARRSRGAAAHTTPHPLLTPIPSSGVQNHSQVHSLATRTHRTQESCNTQDLLQLKNTDYIQPLEEVRGAESGKEEPWAFCVLSWASGRGCFPGCCAHGDFPGGLQETLGLYSRGGDRLRPPSWRGRRGLDRAWGREVQGSSLHVPGDPCQGVPSLSRPFPRPPLWTGAF